MSILTTTGKEENNNNHNTTSKKGIAGNIEELGTHVFVSGTEQQHHCSKILEAIADHIGAEHGMDMWCLVELGKDQAPEPPPTPTTQEQKRDPSWEKHFDKKLDKHMEKLEEHDTTKKIAFIELLGQCSPGVRNQLEATKDCATIKSSADAPKLPQSIKSFVHSNEGAQHDCWTLSFAVRKLATVKQGKSESPHLLLSISFQWTMAQVVESQWGLLSPTQQIATVDENGDPVASTLDANKQAAHDKCLACVLMAGTNHDKCGACIAEPNNSHVAGNSKCPTTVSAASHCLNNCSTGEKTFRTDQEEKKDDPTPAIPRSDCAQVGLHAPTELNNHQKEKITNKHIHVCPTCETRFLLLPDGTEAHLPSGN